MRQRYILSILVISAAVAVPRPARPATIDLTMTSLTGAPASVGVGKTFSLTNKVQTTGAVTKSFTVKLYLSTDSTITTGDTSIGSRTVASLAANGSSTATTSVTVPVGLAPGVYCVGAIADTANTIAESNESNNAIAGSQVTVVGSDLTISSLSGAPASVTAGAGFNLTNVVAANASGGNAGAFTVGLYLSTDSTIATSDTLIGSRSVTSLASGATSSAATAVTVPAGVAAGTYYLGAIADSANTVVESNELNNSFTGPTIQVVVLKPDLSMTSLTGGPARVAPGGTFSVNSTVANASAGAAAGAFTVGFYLSNDNVITTSDAAIGSRSVTNLAIGATSSGATTVTVPAGLAPGMYYLGAIADSAGQVAEANEANNSRLGVQIAVGPDLYMASITNVDGWMVPGTWLFFDRTVANAAGGGGAAGTSTAYYLLPSGHFDEQAIFLGIVSIPPLAGGATDSATEEFLLGSQLSPGQYTIGAVVDAGGTVSESSEGNNEFVGPSVQIAQPPDFTILDLSGFPSSALPGDSFMVACSAMNAPGSIPGDIFVATYLSTDPLISEGDTEISNGWGYSPNAQAGVVVPCNMPVTIPPSTPTGTYYTGAIVNPGCLDLEVDCGNNTFPGPIIKVGPDVIPALLTAPAEVSVGAMLFPSYGVTFTLGGSGQSVRIDFYLSTDSAITTSDTYLGGLTTTYPPDNQAWRTEYGQASLVVPKTLPRGQYYLGMIVDSLGAVAERDEANNATAGVPVSVVFNGCVGVPAGVPCKILNDGFPCRDACDGAGNCVAGAMAARGTACPFQVTCGEVCDGVSPLCQPAE